MKNLNISAIALAISLAFSTNAMAGSMTKNQFKANEKSIEAEYNSAKAGCDSFAANAKDICVAEAKGKMSVAKADLDASYKPSENSKYKARVARADATYSVANEKCDDKAGNEKDICVKEAKSAKIHQIADAETQLKSKNANVEANEKSNNAQAVANEKSVDANAKASETKTDARKDAAAEKRDADYAVAKEKCDALAGNVKDKCIIDAKSRFAQ